MIKELCAKSLAPGATCKCFKKSVFVCYDSIMTRPLDKIEPEQRGYFSIPVKTLRMDELADFDLYIHPATKAQPILYRGANLAFSQDDLDRLRHHGVESLWVSDADRPKLRRYIEKHMGEILSDSTIAVEERSAIMYESAQALVHEAMEDPRSGDIVKRSANLVGPMVQFIYEEGRSFEQLMRVCSFDYYTYTHSVNVFTFSVALAQHLGHAQAELGVFGQGGLLHDLGKSLLPIELINWPGALSDEQWALMRQHPVLGFELLQEQGVQDPVILDVTRHHHEKLNGKGYPDGLCGGEISHWTRILTICDIFDALTTRRSYKDPRHSFESLQFMHAHMADEIDGEIFRAFVGLMGKKGG